MKKNALLFTAGILAVSLLNQSCSSTQATTVSAPIPNETVEVENVPTTKVDRYVSVESVADLNVGMTYAEVIAKLGSKPYNVFSAQANGHRAVQYKYRLLNMEVPTEKINENGVEKGKNKLNFIPGYHDLYIVFDASDKLEFLTTSEGTKTEDLLRENNLLYVIKKDKAKFASDTTSFYRSTNSDAFYPLIPGMEIKKNVKQKEEKVSVIKIEDEGPKTSTEIKNEPKATPPNQILNLLNP